MYERNLYNSVWRFRRCTTALRRCTTALRNNNHLVIWTFSICLHGIVVTIVQRLALPLHTYIILVLQTMIIMNFSNHRTNIIHTYKVYSAGPPKTCQSIAHVPPMLCPCHAPAWHSKRQYLFPLQAHVWPNTPNRSSRTLTLPCIFGPLVSNHTNFGFSYQVVARVDDLLTNTEYSVQLRHWIQIWNR